MSFILSDAVRRTPDIPGIAKAVLRILADHAGNDGTHCYPSRERIADESGFCVRSVVTGLTWLKTHGYIIPVRNMHGGRGLAVEYHIVVEKLSPLDIAAARNRAGDAPFSEKSVHERVHETPQKGARNAQKGASPAPQSGKNHPLNQKEESRESADAPSSSSSEKNDESQTPEPEPEPDMPCQKEQDVLQAFCQATDVETPMRAWRQYVGVFLETHSTPAEITTGYRLMQRQFANYEHKPGIKSLAQHWDEWRSKAKSSLAADRAYRNIPRFEEPTDEERAAMMHSLRHGPWNTVQDTLRARRAPDAPRSYEDLPDIWNPPTPEELAERDAKRAARWQEHLASMRAATAPREEEMAVS